MQRPVNASAVRRIWLVDSTWSILGLRIAQIFARMSSIKWLKLLKSPVSLFGPFALVSSINISGTLCCAEADKDLGEGILVPVFITCDPRRDTPEVVKEYIKDFHPDMIGLTGSEDEIRRVAKSFRVYVSSPPNVSEGEDYLVDHSIFFYLMDPDGKFVDCYAKDTTAKEVASSFKKYVQEYISQGGQIKRT